MYFESQSPADVSFLKIKQIAKKIGAQLCSGCGLALLDCFTLCFLRPYCISQTSPWLVLSLYPRLIQDNPTEPCKVSAKLYILKEKLK